MEIEDLAAVMLLQPTLLSLEDTLLVILSESDNAEGAMHVSYDKFDMENFSSEAFRNFFRFKKTDIHRLVEVLHLKDEYCSSTRLKWSGLEGLCILLCRLCYPNRLSDLVPLFGRHVTELSIIINTMLSEVYDKYHDLLERVDHDWLDVDLYCDAISGKGAAIPTVWGFLDGTQGRICRPNKGQESVYNGHKRQHSLKYQSLILPNGIILHFYGPFEGRRHDSAMYFSSGVDQLISDMTNSRGEEVCIYADSAYAIRSYLITPFKGGCLTQEQSDFNTNMSRLRQSVEWGFGKLTNLFAFIDFHKNLKVYLQPVGKYYLVAALLCNAHTCLYGSETGKYFNVNAPALEDYFKN